MGLLVLVYLGPCVHPSRRLRDGELESRYRPRLAGAESRNETAHADFHRLPARQPAYVDRAAHDALVAETAARHQRAPACRYARPRQSPLRPGACPAAADTGGGRHSAFAPHIGKAHVGTPVTNPPP